MKWDLEPEVIPLIYMDICISICIYLYTCLLVCGSAKEVFPPYHTYHNSTWSIKDVLSSISTYILLSIYHKHQYLNIHFYTIFVLRYLLNCAHCQAAALCLARYVGCMNDVCMDGWFLYNG